jgi:hypothetical protein
LTSTLTSEEFPEQGGFIMASSSKVVSVTATREAAKARRQDDAERALELLHLVQRRAADVKDAFFDMGAAFADLANNRLYLALGHPTFEELVKKETPFSLSQVKKFMVVAELVPRDDALMLGTERAYAVTRLAPLLPDGKPIKALLREAALVDGKPASELSAREIQDEVQRLRARQRPKPRTQPDVENHRKLARETQASLRAHGVKQAVVRAVRRTAGWRLVVEIPPGAAADLLRR